MADELQSAQSSLAHFPLTGIHPQTLMAALPMSSQARFWEMRDTLFRRQKALEDNDIRSAIASREVLGTPTLFIDGVPQDGGL